MGNLETCELKHRMTRLYNGYTSVQLTQPLRLLQDSQLQETFLLEVYDTLFGKYEGDAKSLDQSSDGEQMSPPGYQLTKDLIKSSKKTIMRYDDACQVSLSNGRLPGTEAAEDNICWNLTNLLGQRRKEVKHQVHGLLHETSNSGKGDCVANTSEAKENDIWKSFAEPGEEGNQHTMRGSKGEGWAKAAKYAVQNIRRMVKHLPEDL